MHDQRIRAVVVRRLLLLLAIAGCDKGHPTVAKQTPAPVPAPSDAAPHPDDATTSPADAAAPADADLASATWPTWIQSSMVEDQRTIGQFEINVAYPRFQTRPPEIGKALNDMFVPLADPGIDPKTDQGRLDLDCAPRVVNRLVVIVECHRMRDKRTIAEAQAGTGGAPGGPDPRAIAVWLQPGLPSITLDELAPNVDVNAALASIPASCAGQCQFARDSFVIDEQGDIRFVPKEYCPTDCAVEQAPRIAFADRKSKHPWVGKLDDWIKKRLEAGESLVK